MRLTIFPFAIFAVMLSSECFAQEPDSPVPEKDKESGSSSLGPTLELDVSRRPFKNFLTDEVALKPYLAEDGIPEDFESIFVVGSLQAKVAIFWDPVVCRLLGVLDLDGKKDPVEADLPSTYPYILQAAGPPPLADASGDPEYFGFRLVDGSPEFLYTFGSLVVEERIWLEDLGKTLKQRFSFRSPSRPVTIKIPEDWRNRAEASKGTWDKNVLSIPVEDATEVVLTYQLVQPDTDSTN